MLKRLLVSPEIESRVNSMPKSVGSYGYDPWGYDVEAAKIGMALVKVLYDHYFRATAHGLHNVPKEGRLLVVANHSGQLPWDGMLIGLALATNHYGPRAPRAMVERFLPHVPYFSYWFNQMGSVVGDPVNCVKMLKREETVIVFPEGARGSGKTFNKRYQLQRFGTGFMHIAVEHKVPILPVGVVGCEETMPSFMNIKPLARVFGFPVFPLTTPIPLPVRVIMNFGEPMHFTGNVEDQDEMVAKVDQVKERVTELVNRGLRERKGWF